MSAGLNFQPVKLEDGTIIHVQVAPLGGIVKVAGFKDGYSFETITNSIESISKSVLKAIKKASPNKATIQFGIEVGVKEGKATALLVRGTGTASLTITLEWVKDTASKKPVKKQTK